MNNTKGKITNGEIELGHGPDFSKTFDNSLESVLELVRVITLNAPLRSVEARERTNKAIAELKLKSGFHRIQFELQKALERSSKEMESVDPEESPRELFHRQVRRAIRKGNQTLTVFVEMPSLKQPEMIVNPPENLVEKLTYYMGAYDENMRLKAAPEIRITAFEVGGTGIEFH